MSPRRVSVIGAGSWGTAIAKLLADNGFNVFLWAYEGEVADEINSRHTNGTYLPGIALPKRISASNDVEEVAAATDFIVSVVPSHTARSIWTKAAGSVRNGSTLVSCTKGIEVDSLKLMNEVLGECLPDHPEKMRAVLSGPSFAKEVALGLPASVVIAGTDVNTCRRVQDAFHAERFMTFTSNDVIGVEVGGAIKNAVAIAAGISDGLGLGHNARAAIITRGLYEMIKIGRALGANLLTFSGLSGIGDLVLTCTGKLSRNHSLGERVGSGEKYGEIMRSMTTVAEGVHTSEAIHRLSKRERINTPICEAVYRILFKNLDPREAADQLYAMPLKEELGAIMRDS